MWKVSISTTSEAEDAVTKLLNQILGASAAAYTDLDSGVTTVTAFSERKPRMLSRDLRLLREGLHKISTCGLNIGLARIGVRRFPRKNWAESWKSHFKPIEIGRALLIKPSWSKRQPLKGQGVVILDPGLSFGTGHHPTTSYCLRELARRNQMGASFLDLGTGSGILAIAAAKLGYTPIVAIDFDPASVRVASANARRNGVSQKIRIARGDVAKLPLRPRRQYDVICANLVSTLLMAERRRIIQQLKPGGALIVAGILRSEFDALAIGYEKLGFRLAASKVEKEWRSGTFLASH